VENLAWAIQQAERANLGIVIEALNPIDAPGYFLRSLADAVELMNLVGADRLGLLFDVYHCAQSGIDPVRAFEDCIPLIAHIQVADVPGRHEPGTGTVDWQAVFAAIDRSGYTGLIGCEYRPRGHARQSLSWLGRYAPESHFGTPS
jgi:hydroxypyruvate isomerase